VSLDRFECAAAPDRDRRAAAGAQPTFSRMTMPNPERLFALQLALECKAIVRGDEMARIDGPDPDDIPRAAAVSLGDDPRIYVREDLPEVLKAHIRGLDPRGVLASPDLVARVLAPVSGPDPRWMCSCVIPDGHPLPGDVGVQRLTRRDHGLLGACFESGFAQLAERRPVFAVVIDGVIASACVSVRRNASAAEAWVATDPRHRCKGLARQAVAAWARDCWTTGIVAFYSYEEVNRPSEALARSLRFPRWCRMVAFE